MSELKKITAIILTYKTPKDIILDCIKSLSSEIKDNHCRKFKKF